MSNVISLFLPKRLNVGYRSRSGTYTGKLGYVTYFDEKGVLRKEKSWEGWRDNRIDNTLYDNEKLSGFVINKTSGGERSGWDTRKSYIRVYDPRGFEVEITIDNLLYIIEHSTIEGKNLIGEYIYGWDGAEMVLIPVSSPEFEELERRNNLIHTNNTIRARNLKVGATYLTKQGGEWIYLGRYDYYFRGEKRARPYFWFYCREGKGAEKWEYGYQQIATVSKKVIDIVDETVVEDIEELQYRMGGKPEFSPIDPTKTEFKPYTIEELERELQNYRTVRAYIYYKGYYIQTIISTWYNNTTGKEYYHYYRIREGASIEQVLRGINIQGNILRGMVSLIEEGVRETSLDNVMLDIIPLKEVQYLENGRINIRTLK